MKTFSFNLEYFVENFSDTDLDSQLEKIGKRSTDYLVGIGKKDHVCFMFDRDASTYLEALLTAIKDVKELFPKAKLLRVEYINER